MTTILYVEDNRDNIYMLSRRLKREGFEVHIARDGKEGLSMASEGNTYFAENYRDLPRIFDSEMRDSTTVVARNVRVRIECETALLRSVF